MLIAILLLSAFATPSSANNKYLNQNGYLYDSYNISGVVNGPTTATKFTIKSAVTITWIATYHFNNGMGATPGTISLQKDKGQLYGPFPVQNDGSNWIAPMYLTLPAGVYTVIDSSPATWSYNALSSGEGFTRIQGLPSSTPLSCGSSPLPASPIPYGGNCQGAGCEHPDLTAYPGGNGPFGSGSNNRTHQFIPNTAIFVAFLTPTTSLSQLQQSCTSKGGVLTLLDDEPWYYYFKGNYARFACSP